MNIKNGPNTAASAKNLNVEGYGKTIRKACLHPYAKGM